MSRTSGRKAERKTPEERAAEITATAADLARESGLTAITLRSIAARIGVTPALVAHYQPNMEALVASTFTTVVGEELAEVAGISAAEQTPTARLRSMLTTLLDDTRDDVTVVWLDAWSMGRRSLPLAEAARDEMDAWQRFVHAIIEAGIAQGEFVTDDSDAVAWLLIGMVDGLNAPSLVRYRDTGERAALMNRAVERQLGLALGALAVTSS